MKLMWELLPPAAKAIFGVVAFFVGIGWASYGAVLLIVKAEGQDIRREVMKVRQVDIHYIADRFDRLEAKIDKMASRKEN